MPELQRAAHRGSVFGARVRSGAAAFAIVGSLLVASGASAAVTASNPAKPPARPKHPDVVLSNETTRTTFAEPNYASPIRTQPAPHAHVITSMRFSTPDGFVQTYILLREHWVGRHAWVKLRVPMRPNGYTGWVPLSALAGFQHVNTELIVNRAAANLTLLRNGHVIYRAPVGTGKPSTPTPGGHFWITESFSSNDPFYGPWAFGTSDYSVLSEWPGGGIVGLHGTNEPALIPGHPSHGCIRLRNGDISALSHLVAIGTPLWVQ
jgi:lipoprotein-anchoring transpeptidase ErfK/SrfK